MHVAGVLLVLDSRADRVTNDDVKVFKWLNCFCGPTYYRNITVVFSQWDRLVPDEFEDHKANARLLVEQPELAAILKPHRPYLGGSVYYHGIPGGDMVDGVIALSKKRHAAERSQEAKNMILRRYSDKTGGQLQIVQDMAANKNNWKLTEAGKVLLAGNPAQIELVIQDDRAVVTYPDHHYQPRLSPSGLAPPASATQAVVPEPGAAEPAGPDPAAAGDPAGATPEEAPGFLDSIRTWVDIARAVAQFFGGARTAGAEPAGWSIRGALRTLGSWLWG